MTTTITRTPAFALDAPEIIRLSSWMAAFNRDVPARVLAAVAVGHGFVLVSSPGGVASTLRRAIVQRLKAADFVTLERLAPLRSLSALHDSIRDAMQGGAGRSVVLLIDKAEALDVAMLRRLLALAALSRAGEPVLHILLLAEPAMQSLLREAGRGALWDDAAAHFRLVPELAACLPEHAAKPAPRPFDPRQGGGPQGLARPGTWLPPPRLISPPDRITKRAPTRATAAWAACAIAVASLTYAWSVIAPAPKIVPAPTLPRPIAPATTMSAAPAPAAPPVAPTVAPLTPKPPPSKPSPSPPHAVPIGGDVALHVTVRYRRGDMQAAATATRILSRLRKAGILAAGPLPSTDSRPAVSFGFAQDQAAAAALAKNLHFSSPQPARGSTLNRPGEIGVFVGSAE
ncbi:hypothetical protein [Lichenicoccus sp.]|uniref:hypothetical protein n=1 Tax=Lichenicoccus sp. TaxID=2781899 RepID=UPI003D0D2FAE